MMYPKSKQKKQKKAKNNPKPTVKDRCYYCGTPFAHLHEVFFGNGKRQLSIEYGMQRRLCYWCHEGPDGVHNNPRFNFQLKQEFQEIFELQHGHEKFMEVFGRNYLDMTYEEFIKKGVEVA